MDSSSCLWTINNWYWLSYMYFIIVECESLPTNKIGRSDGVALEESSLFFMPFPPLFLALNLWFYTCDAATSGYFPLITHTNSSFWLPFFLFLPLAPLCTHIVINTQSSLLCDKAFSVYSKLQYNSSHLPHVNVYLFQQYQSRLDNAFGKKGSKIQGMVYKVCGFKKTLRLYSISCFILQIMHCQCYIFQSWLSVFYFADHGCQSFILLIMAVNLLFCWSWLPSYNNTSK